jgi:hypothetical protein
MGERVKDKQIGSKPSKRRSGYVGSQMLDASGQPKPGSPVVQTLNKDINFDSPPGTVPRHAIDERVLAGTNPHRFIVDEKGRPMMAEGQVLYLSNVRNENAQRTVSGPWREEGAKVDATHLIARSLGGPGTFENLVPAPDITNRQHIAEFEDRLRDMVAADPKREIFMQVYVEYGDDKSTMPTELRYVAVERKGDKLEPLEEKSFVPRYGFS